jgi:membrane protein DedA with SNARE-associated domain
VDAFIHAYGYPALFGAMVIEQFVPPLAGEPILLGAGGLAGNGYVCGSDDALRSRAR